MKRFAINRLSKHFGRTIDVTSDLVNGSKWVFTAHLGTGRGYSDDFILLDSYLENLSEYAREKEEYRWIKRFVEDVIDYERNNEKMHTIDEYCRKDIAITKESVAVGRLITGSRIEYDIKDVIFNDPATIVLWKDGTKTVVKATEEEYDPEKGLAMAIAKKRYGNKWDYYNIFKHWLKKYKKPEGDYEQVTYTTKLIMEED
jgi:hypothetical protein